MNGQRLTAAALAVACLAVGFFTGKWAALREQNGEAGGPVVARYRGGRLTANELKAHLAATGLAAHQPSSPEAKARFVKDLVHQQLLVAAAREKGYQNAPEVRRNHQRSLIDVYVQKELIEPQLNQPISDAELEKQYGQAVGEFTRPERVYVAHILFAASQGARDRDAKKAAAQALLKDVLKRSATDPNAFAAAAQAKSDDASTKAQGGAITFASRDELAVRLGPALAAAAFETKGLEVVVDRVLESPQGFHLLKVIGREAAKNPTAADLRDVLRARSVQERRRRLYDEFVAKLEADAQVTIDDAAVLAALSDGAAAAPPAPAPAK
jgi:parvulin-like peptidyl-prolyl isomerase